MLVFTNQPADKFGKLAYGEYDVMLGCTCVAHIRMPLVKSDKLFVYLSEHDSPKVIKINQYQNRYEALDAARNYILKRLYKQADAIMSALSVPCEFSE